MSDIQTVLDFWFLPPGDENYGRHRAQWFLKDPEFDQQVRTGFIQSYNLACNGKLLDWADTPEGSLALILIMDQFPRNIFRENPKAFESDGKALEIARHAIAAGYMESLLPVQKKFMALPFEHSEVLAEQERAIRIFTDLGVETDLEYARQHFEIIKKFGRFPHRNDIVGRKSTPEEIEFLRKPGSSF